jgi:hypothetical protein
MYTSAASFLSPRTAYVTSRIVAADSFGVAADCFGAAAAKPAAKKTENAGKRENGMTQARLAPPWHDWFAHVYNSDSSHPETAASESQAPIASAGGRRP